MYERTIDDISLLIAKRMIIAGKTSIYISYLISDYNFYILLYMYAYFFSLFFSKYILSINMCYAFLCIIYIYKSKIYDDK